MVRMNNDSIGEIILPAPRQQHWLLFHLDSPVSSNRRHALVHITTDVRTALSNAYAGKLQHPVLRAASAQNVHLQVGGVWKPGKGSTAKYADVCKVCGPLRKKAKLEAELFEQLKRSVELAAQRKLPLKPLRTAVRGLHIVRRTP